MQRFVKSGVLTIAVSVLSLSPRALPSFAQSGTSSRHSKPITHANAALELGTLKDGLYRNQFFAFSYNVPFGWVDRTKSMREDSPQPATSQLLLSTFERPPEATGDTINSAVVIAAENVSIYPGLKDASQYFRPLTEVTTSKGFKVVNEPYDADIEGKHLVRADFSKPMGNLSMYQSTLAIISKGFVVSFTFIAGTQDEVDKLVSNLRFTTGPRSSSQP